MAATFYFLRFMSMWLRSGRRRCNVLRHRVRPRIFIATTSFRRAAKDLAGFEKVVYKQLGVDDRYDDVIGANTNTHAEIGICFFLFWAHATRARMILRHGIGRIAVNP